MLRRCNSRTMWSWLAVAAREVEMRTSARPFHQQWKGGSNAISPPTPQLLLHWAPGDNHTQKAINMVRMGQIPMAGKEAMPGEPMHSDYPTASSRSPHDPALMAHLVQNIAPPGRSDTHKVFSQPPHLLSVPLLPSLRWFNHINIHILQPNSPAFVINKHVLIFVYKYISFNSELLKES